MPPPAPSFAQLEYVRRSRGEDNARDRSGGLDEGVVLQNDDDGAAGAEEEYGDYDEEPGAGWRARQGSALQGPSFRERMDRRSSEGSLGGRGRASPGAHAPSEASFADGSGTWGRARQSSGALVKEGRVHDGSSGYLLGSRGRSQGQSQPQGDTRGPALVGKGDDAVGVHDGRGYAEREGQEEAEAGDEGRSEAEEDYASDEDVEGMGESDAPQEGPAEDAAGATAGAAGGSGGGGVMGAALAHEDVLRTSASEGLEELMDRRVKAAASAATSRP